MMWNNSQSDVARISQVLEANAPDADKLYAKFTGTTQEPVRLAAALRGFFWTEGVCPAQKDAYGAYLHRRIRPAAEALIEQDRLDQLEALADLGWLDAALVDQFLQTAVRQRKSAIAVWLLRLKSERYGYRDRDFSL